MSVSYQELQHARTMYTVWHPKFVKLTERPSEIYLESHGLPFFFIPRDQSLCYQHETNLYSEEPQFFLDCEECTLCHEMRKRIQKTMFHYQQYRESQELYRRSRYFYHVTLTKRPEVPVAKFAAAINKFVSRKAVELRAATLEHMDTNIHAHIFFQYDRCFKKYLLDSYAKQIGMFKLDPVRKDNGVQAYIEKQEDHPKEVFYSPSEMGDYLSQLGDPSGSI